MRSTRDVAASEAVLWKTNRYETWFRSAEREQVDSAVIVSSKEDGKAANSPSLLLFTEGGYCWEHTESAGRGVWTKLLEAKVDEA